MLVINVVRLLAAWRSSWERLTFFAQYLYWLVGLDAKFLDSGSQPPLNGSPRNVHTSLVCVKPQQESLANAKVTRDSTQIEWVADFSLGDEYSENIASEIRKSVS